MLGSFALDVQNGTQETFSQPRHKARSKRTQVTRACAWCRLNRVRCDNNPRCRNCRQRNQECRREDDSRSLTLPLALEEIEKLRSQVLTLETQLQRQRSPEGNNTDDEEILAVRPPSSAIENQAGRKRGPRRNIAENHYMFDAPSLDDMSLQRRGFLTESTNGRAGQFYGLSSLHNLIHRLKVHLYLAYGWVYMEEKLHPKVITLSLASPSGLDAIDYPADNQRPPDWRDGVFMGKEQEEECLRLFWQSYHCAIPVLDERKFQEHHSSLWSSHNRSDDYRDDSALVDVILAMCVQYGMTRVEQNRSPLAKGGEYNITDPSNAGRWYFKRSQALLKAELENPSILLLQCQILSVVYLRDASLFHMASSTVAAAIQTTYSLGLHMETNEFSNIHESELHKRLWCMVFALEGKMSMDYGRPFLAQTLSIQLPRDDHELASRSAELFVPYSRLKITWLTYHVQHVKLIRISREVFSKTYNYVAQQLASQVQETFGHDKDIVRRCDAVLIQELDNLKDWSDKVPKELQYHSTASRAPTDREMSVSDMTRQTPLWLQRQRVMLRLLYHDIFLSLCRPFAIFPSPNEPVFAPTQSALECLNHSMAITDIAREALGDINVLDGWHRAYQFQWDAALCMIAFAFANLESPLIDQILLKVGDAISVLDTFGRCFAVARSATEIIRDLRGKLQIASTQR